MDMPSIIPKKERRSMRLDGPLNYQRSETWRKMKESNPLGGLQATHSVFKTGALPVGQPS